LSPRILIEPGRESSAIVPPAFALSSGGIGIQGESADHGSGRAAEKHCSPREFRHRHLLAFVTAAPTPGA
jgi:hypothetical protein